MIKFSSRFVLAAIALAALSIEALAWMAMRPLALEAIDGAPARPLLRAGAVAARSVAAAARERAADLAGDGMVAAARGAATLYATLLRLSPDPAPSTGARWRLVRIERVASAAGIHFVPVTERDPSAGGSGGAGLETCAPARSAGSCGRCTSKAARTTASRVIAPTL